MFQVHLKPILITAKDEGGIDVPIDVTQLCSWDENLHALMKLALERFFEGGAVTDFPVGISITIFDRAGQSGTALTTDWNKDTDLEHYSPELEAILDRRNLPPEEAPGVFPPRSGRLSFIFTCWPSRVRTV